MVHGIRTFADVSDSLINILHLMLKRDLNERPSAEELLNLDEVKMKRIERHKVRTPLSFETEKWNGN